jgi:hypothetical protein
MGEEINRQRRHWLIYEDWPGERRTTGPHCAKTGSLSPAATRSPIWLILRPYLLSYWLIRRLKSIDSCAKNFEFKFKFKSVSNYQVTSTRLRCLHRECYAGSHVHHCRPAKVFPGLFNRIQYWKALLAKTGVPRY